MSDQTGPPAQGFGLARSVNENISTKVAAGGLEGKYPCEDVGFRPSEAAAWNPRCRFLPSNPARLVGYDHLTLERPALGETGLTG
jgi:hypothetical protein